MMQKERILSVLLLLLLLTTGFLAAQESNQAQYARRFQNGAQLYALSHWQEAAMEFRRSQELAQNVNDWSQALYWVILSELAFSDYGSALRDMDELERRAPNSIYSRDMLYHRARVYYIQGYYEDALILFNRYNASTTDTDRVAADRRAASFFWMGECLYAMVQYDEAEKFFSWVLARYPQSPKVEAAAYRIDLIKQKKIETELLALLQQSHEESLRTSEDYQRTIRTYENTLNIYQRRLAELVNPQNVNPQNVNPQNVSQVTQNAAPQVSVEEPPYPIPENNQANHRNGNNLIEKAIELESHVQGILEGGTW